MGAKAAAGAYIGIKTAVSSKESGEAKKAEAEWVGIDDGDPQKRSPGTWTSHSLCCNLSPLLNYEFPKDKVLFYLPLPGQHGAQNK